MAVYIFAENVVRDRGMFGDYVAKVGPTVIAHGGRYLVRAGRTESPEEEWTSRDSSS